MLVYFVGCMATYRLPSIAKSTIEILKKSGIDFTVMGDKEWCCGSVALRTGHIDIARKLAQHNVEEIKKLGADRISFKTIQLSDFESGEEYLPDNPVYTRYVAKTKDGKYITKKRKMFSNECLRLWYSFVINCDGRVSPCCFDKDGDYALGNLIEDSFESIWNGNKFQRFRQNLLKNRYGFDMCFDCTEGLKEIYQQTVDYQRDKK